METMGAVEAPEAEKGGEGKCGQTHGHNFLVCCSLYSFKPSGASPCCSSSGQREHLYH